MHSTIRLGATWDEASAEGNRTRAIFGKVCGLVQQVALERAEEQGRHLFVLCVLLDHVHPQASKVLCKTGNLATVSVLPQFGTQYTQRIWSRTPSSTVSWNPPIVGADGSIRPRIFHCVKFRYR